MNYYIIMTALIRRQNEGVEIEMVWTPTEEICSVYRMKDAGDRTAKQEKRRKAREEFYEGGEGGMQAVV